MKARSGRLLTALLAMVCVVLPALPAAGQFHALDLHMSASGQQGVGLGPQRDSLEWMTARAELIVRATCMDAGRDPAGMPMAKLVVRDTVKGPKTDSVLVSATVATCRKGDWLFFLIPSRAIALDFPRYVVANAIDLSGDDCARMDFSAVTGEGPILQAVHDALGFLPRDKVTESMWLMYPPTFPYGSREGVLTVPVIPRLEELARQWAQSDDIGHRRVAVQALQEFRSRENIQLLKKLLNDPGSFVEGSTKRQLAFPLSFITVEEGGTRYYPVRKSAWELLTAWNVNLDVPVTQEPAGELSPWMVPLLVTIPVLVLVAAVTVLFRLRRRRLKSSDAFQPVGLTVEDPT